MEESESQLYGLNFSPYLVGKQPPGYISPDEIKELIQIIKSKTKWVRTFGTQSGLEVTGKIAHENGLKIMMGAWIGTDSSVNSQQLKNLMDQAQNGYVDIAAIGNEVLLRGDQPESVLLDYIQTFKKKFPNIPVTVVDTYQLINSHPNIIAAVDVIVVNIYPYWEGYSIDAALQKTIDAYNSVKQKAGGKTVIIGEMGWPSDGDTNGNAVPSLPNFQKYLRQSVVWATSNNIPFFYFEAFDEAWKAPLEKKVGSHWGLWTLTQKTVF